MLSLLDNEPRYMLKIIDKYVEVRDRNYVTFPVGRATIIDTMGQNRVQLAKIERLMDTLQPIRIFRRFNHHYRFILSRRFDGDQQPYCRRTCPRNKGAPGAQVRPRGRYAHSHPLDRRGLDAAQAPDTSQQRYAQLGANHGHDRSKQ